MQQFSSHFRGDLRMALMFAQLSKGITLIGADGTFVTLLRKVKVLEHFFFALTKLIK